MSNINIKDIIQKLSSEFVEDPNELSKYVVVLSAEMWRYGKDRLEKDIAQAKKWSEIRAQCETDGQADKRIKATQEWADWQMAVIAEKTVNQLIMALKKRLTSMTDEMIHGR